jgi:N-carbamoyl-L-amino-acid hydrolase
MPGQIWRPHGPAPRSRRPKAGLFHAALHSGGFRPLAGQGGAWFAADANHRGEFMPNQSFDDCLPAAIDASWTLMAEIGLATRGRVGITRPAYDDAEQHAAEATAHAARAAGLSAEFDAFGNLHVILHGADNSLPAIGFGSHFDSVPDGGNYDGLAGVMAGLAILAAARRAGLVPGRSLHLVGLRGEESPWYGTAYLGSRLALGHTTMGELGRLTRLDTGVGLAEHAARLGFTATPDQEPSLSPANLACWLELHIEQGPLLIEQGVPIGVATAIRGNIRHPTASCHGAWAHSAAVPRAHRRDAVVAVAELIMRIDAFWTDRLAEGCDNFVATVGQFATDPALHAMTKVPGRVDFSLNLGASDPVVLAQAKAMLAAAVSEIEGSRGVRFELGADVGSSPTALDAGLMDALENAAAARGLGHLRMPTVGHDAGMFAKAGIPAAMVLVRNQNGSHNPEEAMEAEDYAAGVMVLAGAVLGLMSR